MFLLRSLWFGVLVSGGATLAPAAEPEFDLVIRGGRVVDGSGNPWFQGDVAIRGDRIAAIGSVAGAGRREINATGLVVSPGFVDIHSHSDWLLLEDGGAPGKIRQGVTTEILGESISAGPFQDQMPAHRQTVQGRTVEIRALRDYFAAIEKAGVAVNVGSYVGQGQVWECVMGGSFDRPTPAQIDRMKELVGEAMRDGALGLSTALLMPPSSLATTADLVALARVAAAHGGIYSSHIRDEGFGVFDSIKEAIAVGEQTGLPVDIIHVKIADEKYWGKMSEVLALIEEARRRGVNVQANVYPYTRGNNDLRSIIPPWAHEGGNAKLLERLRDPQLRLRLKQDIQTVRPDWYNHYTAVGGDWSRMQISANNTYKGMTMDKVIAAKRRDKPAGYDAFDVLFDLLLEQNGFVGTVYAHHTEADMNLAMVQPWTSIGSDGSAFATEGLLRRGNPHPRNFGTFPRILGVYVRERGVLRLEDAIRKMTSLNAAKVGLQDRGTLRTGAFADVTIFNAERIIDRSTYEDPFHYPEGIEYVIVNGQVSLEKGVPTPARGGRALRHASRMAP